MQNPAISRQVPGQLDEYGHSPRPACFQMLHHALSHDRKHRQAGFEIRTKEGPRTIQLDLNVPGRQAPLLLFDAADPANLGWFSRCQFYVDGRTGSVMQTPINLANKRDRSGRAHGHSVRLVISK